MDKVWLKTCFELSFSTHYVVNYMIIHAYYLNKSHGLFLTINDFFKYHIAD